MRDAVRPLILDGLADLECRFGAPVTLAHSYAAILTGCALRGVTLCAGEPDVQQPIAMRDCGAGPNDPGCLMRKNGVYPMDGVAFDGALKTLRSQRNTITREEMAKKMLGRNVLTAAQLGLVIDAFADHGITQLDVAKLLAPNVVNPQHALVHSTKFTNSISAEEYVETMSAQTAGY